MKEPNEALAPEAPPGTPEANLSGPAKPEKSPLLREVRSLAVRLAVCQLCLPGEDPAPLVLDDALVTFDDRRMALALDALAELGRERQILLFTCQEREENYLEGRPGVTRTARRGGGAGGEQWRRRSRDGGCSSGSRP